MNLFGNALKYTDDGFIHVRLECRPVQSYAMSESIIGHDEECFEVVLVVTDSGRGMSVRYLRDHLFHPFAQEDPLSPGTGLGLSIVRQIVNSLGGRIDVRSEKGQGTQVMVSVNLNRVRSSRTHHKKDFQSLQNKTISITGLARTQSNRHSSMSEDARALLDSTLEYICRTWLGMRVIPLSQNSDVCIATEAMLNDERVPISAPVLVLNIQTGRAAAEQQKCRYGNIYGRGAIQSISLPCGPKKLAKALTLCLGAPGLNELIGPIVAGQPNVAMSPTVKPSLDQDCCPKSDARSDLINTAKDGPLEASSQSFGKVGCNVRPLIRRNPTSCYPDALRLNVLIVDDNEINLQVRPYQTDLRIEELTLVVVAGGICEAEEVWL